MRKRIFAIILTALIMLAAGLPLGGVAAPAQISEFGRQVAEDFLMQFYPILSGIDLIGVHKSLETNNFYDTRFVEDSFGNWYEDIRQVEIEELAGFFYPNLFAYMWVRGGQGNMDKLVLVDTRGNVITETEAPHILGDAVAWSITGMYDMDNDGIPEIVIRFGVPETCNVAGVVFKFIDGEFRQVTGFSSSWLFFDDNGDIIYIAGDFTGSGNYYRLRFTDSGIEKEIIVAFEEWGGDEWREHHRYPYFDNNPTIIGTNIPLTPVPRLTGLQAEITTSINQRLGLTRVTDAASAAPATFDPTFWLAAALVASMAALIAFVRSGRKLMFVS